MASIIHATKYACAMTNSSGILGSIDLLRDQFSSLKCAPAEAQPNKINSWWLGAHTSAPKAPFAYAAESRSKASQGLGWVGKEQTSDRCAGVIQVGHPKTVKWMRKQKGRKSGNRPDPEDPALLNYLLATLPLRHSVTLPLCHRYSATSATVVLVVILELARLAPSQAPKLHRMRIRRASTLLSNINLGLTGYAIIFISFFSSLQPLSLFLNLIRLFLDNPV